MVLKDSRKPIKEIHGKRLLAGYKPGHMLQYNFTFSVQCYIHNLHLLRGHFRNHSQTLNYFFNHSDDVLSRTGAAKNVHTSDDKNGWISVDLALWVIPSHYTLRHSRGFGRSALRNWLFQVGIVTCDM